MPEEQMLLDLDQSPPPERYYFALRPDIAAAREILKAGERCRKRHGLSARLYDVGRLHVSLAPVISPRGFRKGDAEAAFGAAASVSANTFTVSFGRLCTFGVRDRSPVVLRCDDGIAALAAFRQTLRNALVRAGLSHGPSRFEPHVTLFWDRCRVPETRLDVPIRWTVEDFVLVRAAFGTGRYADLARWPLHRGKRAE